MEGGDEFGATDAKWCTLGTFLSSFLADLHDPPYTCTLTLILKHSSACFESSSLQCLIVRGTVIFFLNMFGASTSSAVGACMKLGLKSIKSLVKLGVVMGSAGCIYDIGGITSVETQCAPSKHGDKSQLPSKMVGGRGSSKTMFAKVQQKNKKRDDLELAFDLMGKEPNLTQKQAVDKLKNEK